MRMHAAGLCLLLLVSASDGQAPIERTSKGGLHFAIEGSGDPVVLIHAFHMDLREWDDVTALIREKRRVLRYDVRGHGRSEVRDPLPPSVDDLRALLDELEISRATLVGCSMGSAIALDFALTHPARVERLILLSAGVQGIKTSATFEWMQPILAAVKEKNSTGAAALWWQSPLLVGLRGLPNAERYRAIVLDNARIWTIPRPPPRPPAGERLSEVRVPVMTAAGELDRPGIESARAVAAGVQRGTSIVVPNSAHMLSIERAAHVSAWILAELKN